MSEHAWEGYARTNWVRVSNLKELNNSATNAGLSVKQNKDDPELFCLIADDCDLTGFPSINPGDSTDFTFDRCIMPHIEINQVLIAIEVGGQRFANITGYTCAFIRKEDGIACVALHLHDIYLLAATTFKVEEKDITEAID